MLLSFLFTLHLDYHYHSDYITENLPLLLLSFHFLPLFLDINKQINIEKNMTSGKKELI